MIGIIITAVFSSSVISTLLTLAGGYFIVNKKAADYANELEKKRKVAEIYYEERAKVLQELYILLVNLPSDCVNLMRFLGKNAQGVTFSNPQAFHESFRELKENEGKIKKALLNSSLYLKEDDYIIIKAFRDNWGEPVKTIVDLFVLYEETLDVNFEIQFDSDEFRKFSDKALKDGKLVSMFKEYTEPSEDFEEIANIIKRAIASEDIL